MHGVQPMPKTMPSSGAPARPVAGREPGLDRALQERELADEDEPEGDDDEAHAGGRSRSRHWMSQKPAAENGEAAADEDEREAQR